MIKAAIGVGLALVLAAAGLARATDISGVGATSPAPLYARWAELYRPAGGGGFNYMAIGSRNGLKQIKAGTVDFGASDMPLTPQELDAAGLAQFPTAVGGVVPVINLLGLNPGELKLTGPLLAEIYLGRITHWDDPKLVAVNPHVALPHAPIQLVHRADGSGATLAFTRYLTLKSPDWKTRVGAGLDVAWPKGAAGKGNEGVAALVRNTPGAIGYLEYAFARESHLSAAQLPSSGGGFVTPDARSFARAAGTADFLRAPAFGVSLIDPPGPAWPITSATYILVRRNQTSAETGAAVLKFFDWAYRNGDPAATQLDYVPLPGAVKAEVRRRWAAEVTGPDGKPVYVAK